MLANYPDLAHVHEHNEELGREVRTNRLESRLRKGSDRHPLRRGIVLLTLALGVALVAVTALTGVAPKAEAVPTAETVVFSSNRTAGPGVDNPTRDYEIFKMNPDGTGVRQLTFNKGDDYEPILSPDGTRIAFTHRPVQPTEQGGFEIWVVNTRDGSGIKNLTANGRGVDDYGPAFSPGSKRITYTSFGEQTSNPEGDNEIYLMSAVDGSGKKNLTDNGVADDGTNPGS